MGRARHKALLGIILLLPLFIPMWVNISQLTPEDLEKLSIYDYAVVGLDAFAVGAFEEILMRGILLNGFLIAFSHKKHGIWLAVISSSILFGIAHFVNLLSGSPLDSTLFQVFYATMFGIAFCAAYLRTNNLLIPILIHGIIDYLSFLQDAANPASTQDPGIMHLGIVVLTILVILFAIPAIFSVVFLRSSKREEIINMNLNMRQN